MVLGEEAGSKAIDVLRSHSGSQYLQISQAADLFLRYGLIFIMFHIGLGTYVISQLRSLDSDSLKVAVIGAFTPWCWDSWLSWCLPPAYPMLGIFLSPQHWVQPVLL